jgi:hypothetical protein
MNRKLTFSIVILFFSIKSFSQYFQETRMLFSSPSCCGQGLWGSANYFCFDEFGRAYYHAVSNSCTFFCLDSYHTRYDFNNYSSPSFISSVSVNNEKIFPGHSGNFYGFTGNNNYLVKISSSGAGSWNIALSASNAAYNYVNEDYFGNVYALGSDSIKKFDSTGVNHWSKSGGGTIVKADLIGNYYIVNGYVSKYSSNGNLIRNMTTYSANDLLIDPACNIYLGGSSGITKLDSAGNLIYHYSSAAVKIAIDKNENVYIMSATAVKKLDSTGTVIKWTRNFPEGTLRGVGVDSLFNCYVMGDLESGFVPPASFYSYNTYAYASNSYYLFITKLSSDLYSDTVETYSVANNHRLCAGDSINVYFKFFLQNSLPPFKVQLSDSNGSFTNPVLLGTVTGNYLKVLIPLNIPSANGYRIRVKTTTGSPILIPNADGPFRINNKPPSAFTVSNYTSYQNGIYYGCSTGIPIQLTASPIPDGKYQWYKYISPSPGYSYISGASNVLYNTPPVVGNTFYALFTTDTTTGCTGISGLDTVWYLNPVAPYISSLQSSICLNHAPISLMAQPIGSYFPVNGSNTLMFDPGSAGVGIHNITCEYNSPGCGISDTVQSITVNPLPSAIISTNGSTTFCSGDSVILNAPYHLNRIYQWKKGGIDISGANSSNYTASLGGIYKVTVTNTTTGCSKTTISGTSITVTPLPNAIITPQGQTTFCAGNNVVLKANSGSGLTYKWKKDGTFISGANSITYTAFVAGTYKVQTTNSNGCKKLSSGVDVAVPCRLEGNLNETNSDLSIFPNPTSGKFTIQSNSEKISQITITNLSGQTIFKKDFQNNFNSQIEIDLTSQSKGIYLVQSITDKEVYNQKIILN